jgi:hypothetical protein
MAYYLYDPGDDDFRRYETTDAAMRAGRELIDIYRDQCDPEWPEYVEGIAIYESDNPDEPHKGKMVARSVTCDVVSRPDDVDENGYSPSTDKWFNEVDFWCDYRMEMR